MCRGPECGSKPSFEGHDIESGVRALVKYASDALSMQVSKTIDKEDALVVWLTGEYKLPEAIAEPLADFFRLIAPGNKEQPLYLYVQGGEPGGKPAFTKILASKAKFDGDCPDISKCPTLAVLIERDHNNRIDHMAFLFKQEKPRGPGEPLAQHAMAFGFRRKADGTIEEYDVSLDVLKSSACLPLKLEEAFPGRARYVGQLRGVLKREWQKAIEA